MIRSRLYSKGSSGATDLNSKSRYSLRRHRCNRKKLVACELREANYWASENKNELTYFVFFLRDTEPNLTSSRNKQKCGSWLSKPSMMRSASNPYRQWRVLGLYPSCALDNRMYSIILCSPSPGTSWPERMTSTPCQLESSVIFLFTK